ncbi:MAG: DNA-deoxyinosine glycosylase [Bullifex sp.]
MEREAQIHTIGPLFTEHSKILILGSFPSVKSREVNFFYGHKMNRFWPVMERLFGLPLPSIDERRNFILSHDIALWDVIGSCTIEGSGDQSIRDVVPNDLSLITSNAPISHIFTNGGKAYQLYLKHDGDIAIPVTPLPSTSPANASFSLDRLVSEWSVITQALNT